MRPLRLLPALVSLFLVSVLSDGAFGALSQPRANLSPSACRASLDYGVEEIATPLGPKVLARAAPRGTRPLDAIGELRIGQYNVLNLYNYQGRWVADQVTGAKTFVPGVRPKPMEQWAKLKEVIERSDDDVMVWEEVEDIEAAQDFVDQELGGRYRVILIEGNDERGIDVATLLKKDLPFDLEIQSHRAITFAADAPGIRRGERVFSRDLPVMKVRKAGARPGEPPLLILAGTHFKSQRDGVGDPRSVFKRTGQVKETVSILKGVQRENPDVPVFLLGDFNADLRKGSEFRPLWDAGFADTFDLGKIRVKKEDRVTHTFHPNHGPVNYSQLDGILASPEAQRKGIVVKTEIIPDLDAQGRPLPPARTLAERDQQGSDHRKLRMTLDFRKLLGL